MNFVEIENQTKLKILKIVLLQKIVFKILYRSKEERIKNLEKWVRKGYVTDFDLDEMIAALKAELEKTAEQRNAEAKERIQKEKDEKEERKRNRSKTDKIRLQKMLENCTDDYTDEPGSLNTDTNPKYINTEGEMIQKDKEIIIEKNEDTPIIQNRF